MKPAILFRRSWDNEHEFKSASKYFEVWELRTQCLNNVVVPRYSSLPYYLELEKDLKNKNCKLINDYKQHRWISDFEYYEYLKHCTPETWTDQDFYLAPEGSYVVKGRTNSRKNQWKKAMFAQGKKDALLIGADLIHDSLICSQGIIYRKYIPLKTYEIGIDGLPFSNEWRFFYYKDARLAYGYYWSIADNIEQAIIDNEGLEFAQKVADIACRHVDFYSLDIAEKENGGWILIEINCGTMSGLSEVCPDELYSNLLKVLL